MIIDINLWRDGMIKKKRYDRVKKRDDADEYVADADDVDLNRLALW